MAILDCIPLFNELDILELRLTELYDFVDAFVIVEATRTHKGDPKPLHFAENKERFKEWLPKIRHIVVEDMPEGEGLAAIRRREMFQRNCILRGLWGTKDDDVLLISDADEIPRRHLLPRDGLPDGLIVTYLQKLYYYNLNTHAPERPWPGTRAVRVADARCLSPHIVRNGMGQPDAHYPLHARIQDGGWHYSYFGDIKHIQNKMTQFLHQELVSEENTDPAMIATRVASGVDIWGREHEQQFVIGPADDLPAAIMIDPMKWAHLFAEGWAPEFHEDWYDGGQALYVGHLAKQAPEGGALVEIGAWEGRSTVAIAQAVAPKGLFVVDSWRGNEDEGDNHPSVVAAYERNIFAAFSKNIKRLTSGNIGFAQSKWQDWIQWWDQPIAFLHLDAAHDRESVRDCLEAVKPFLVPGAILCGDDAYAEPVARGVADVFPDAKIIGERLWVWQVEG